MFSYFYDYVLNTILRHLKELFLIILMHDNNLKKAYIEILWYTEHPFKKSLCHGKQYLEIRWIILKLVHSRNVFSMEVNIRASNIKTNIQKRSFEIERPFLVREIYKIY